MPVRGLHQVGSKQDCDGRNHEDNKFGCLVNSLRLVAVAGDDLGRPPLSRAVASVRRVGSSYCCRITGGHLLLLFLRARAALSAVRVIGVPTQSWLCRHSMPKPLTG